MKHKFLKRLGAVLTAAALTVSMGAVSAFAADPTPQQNLPTIDFNQKTTLNITKLAGAEDGTPEGHAPIQGVVYNVYKVADWVSNADRVGADMFNPEIKTLAEAQAKITAETEPAKTATTDSNGLASLTELPLGLYLVREADISQATINGKPANITQKSADFLVTLPSTNAEGTAWAYTVAAYPKNQVGTVAKTVDKDNAGVGEDVTYTITARVPENVKPGTGTGTTQSLLTKFQVHDTLAEVLDYKSLSVAGLKADTDYKLTQKGQDVTVDFNMGTAEAPVYSEAVQALAGKNAVITLTATVNKNATTEPFKNKAIANAGEATYESAEVQTKVGSLKITKEDADSKAPLEGATFELYTDEACTKPVDAPYQDGTQTYTVTTGADGTASFTGLKFGTYYAKEVQAPAGYNLLAGPVKVTVGDHATVTVKNVKKDKFPLPITGGAGTALFGIVGAGLIAGGAAVYFASRKKKEDK